MPHPRAFDAHVVAVAHLVLVVAVQLLAQKRGDIIGFDGVNRRADQLPIETLQVRLAVEHDVGGILGRVQTPVILRLDLAEHRTVALGKLIQSSMQSLRLPVIGDLLRFAPILRSR